MTRVDPYRRETIQMLRMWLGFYHSQVIWNHNVNPYVCIQGKNPTAHDLKTHMLTHTGEKSHLCSVCGQTFAYVKILKLHRILHRMTHTGEKPHKFTECDKLEFTSSSHLKRHKLTISLQTVWCKILPITASEGTHENPYRWKTL